MSFDQATIKVEREKEFDELKNLVERAFHPERVARFLKRVQSKRRRVRDLESILGLGVLDGEGRAAKALYDALTVSDQAQMREFYLSRVEEAGPELRRKFHKIYQYY